MATPKLSILIATVENRKQEFRTLVDELERQKKPFPDDWVEILSICDDKTMIIGDKRNRLLDMARGDWVLFIDDDDWIHAEYVKKTLNAIIENEPDCIGWKIMCEWRDIHGNLEKTEKCKVSNVYDKWYQKMGGWDHLQCIYHKNPVRRELALKARFPEINYGEDFEYGQRLKKYLKTEVFIDEYMYIYRYTEEPGGYEARYGEKKPTHNGGR